MWVSLPISVVLPEPITEAAPEDLPESQILNPESQILNPEF
jgi:hypothetical protein